MKQIKRIFSDLLFLREKMKIFSGAENFNFLSLQILTKELDSPSLWLSASRLLA
jgi:hypothetical protein